MKTIGVLGGVGPEATASLFLRIIQATPAKKDQQHIPVIIFNKPQIPDRTEGILFNGEDPLPALIETAKQIERANADLILIPCNTAHYYLPQIQKEVSIPIINMIEETAKFIRKNYPSIKNVGLIATSGTVKTRIYHQELAKHGIKVISPNDVIQETVVMDAIYGTKGIKAGFHKLPRQKIERVGELLMARGADMIIAGCTEISLILKQRNVNYVVIDPMTLLAETSVEIAIAPPEMTIAAQEMAPTMKKVREIIEE
ncbi:MAG: amino acid racemase [Nanoarchaeota archaeon]|nr:amino acid racemase [Nanoarchaeota archaeon]